VTPDRYWRDVGTLDAYYDANMDLLSPIPPLDLYQDSWAIRTYQGQHPPARVVPGPDGVHGDVHNSILGSGSVVIGGSVINSILSARVRVHPGACVESSILFDNVQVGAGASLRRCIIDKNVRIPENMRIGHDSEADGRLFRISTKGIVAVPKTFDAVQLDCAARGTPPGQNLNGSQNLNV
jgi:glucose-1-phosphate adenylyltransferase